MLSLSHFGSQRVAMAPERGGYLTVTQHRPLRSLKMALRYRTVNLGRNAQPPISGPSAANELCIHLDNTQLTFGESRRDVSYS
jgi:hypothetical protein